MVTIKCIPPFFFVVALLMKAKGKKKTPTKLSCSQQTLRKSLESKYDKESQRYQFITRKLALFVGGTNVANSIVENVFFQSLLEALDSRYPIPGRTLIGKEIDKVVIDMKAKIEVFLSQSNKVSLCADIWTKKGMSSSYLTEHEYSHQLLALEEELHILLHCLHFTSQGPKNLYDIAIKIPLYENVPLVGFVMRGLKSWFRIGFGTERENLVSRPQNMLSTIEHPEVMSKYVS